MNRDDVERIVENVLKELRIDVTNCDFTNPNGRRVKLMLGDTVISDEYLDVTPRREYEG